MAVFDIVHHLLSDLLGMPVRDDAPFMGAGLDSLGAAELLNRLSAKLSIHVELTALFSHPTVSSLSSFLDRELSLYVESVCTAGTRNISLLIMPRDPP